MNKNITDTEKTVKFSYIKRLLWVIFPILIFFLPSVSSSSLLPLVFFPSPGLQFLYWWLMHHDDYIYLIKMNFMSVGCFLQCFECSQLFWCFFPWFSFLSVFFLYDNAPSLLNPPLIVPLSRQLSYRYHQWYLMDFFLTCPHWYILVWVFLGELLL